ncbi:MAG: class B sortase [Clostridia bacterium]|nr:class B sortase [Clostridia bacterium]
MRKNTRKPKKASPIIALASVLILAGGIAIIVPIVQDNQEMLEEAAEYSQLTEQVQQEHEDFLFPATTELSEEAQLDDAVNAQDADTISPAYEQVHPPNGDIGANESAASLVLPEPSPVIWETASSLPAVDHQHPGKPAEQHDIRPTNKPPDSVPTETPILLMGNTDADLAACQAKNPDFVAWMKIPGTNVNYPVVLSDDTDYYLTHSFTGKQSKLGTLFSLGKTDYKTPSQNIAIYGHHITNTSSGQLMFRPLLSYKQRSFYENHSIIYLDSLYHISTYKIFAVINMVKDDWDPSTASFASYTDFLAFVRQAQAQSLYDMGVEVSASDRILTLITCDRSYAAADGRLIVMAVEQ